MRLRKDLNLERVSGSTETEMGRMRHMRRRSLKVRRHGLSVRSIKNTVRQMYILTGRKLHRLIHILQQESWDRFYQFIPSFGLIILILAVLVKVIISPLTYKSYISTAKMRVIKPEVDELAKKYPRQEDAMKRQQATMELYKKAGINPMGGCIPLLIQMPIIIAMFRFFPASIELRGQHFLWADDLSSYDSVLSLPFNIPFYGDHVSLFALLMTVALFAFSYINYQQTASSQPQMAGMKFMMVYLMPVMMLLWFNSYSSGLTYYYFLANILTIGQTLVIRRMIDDEKIHAVMQANAAKNKNRKKSKFQLRYEELLRQQEEAQRNASRRK